jgi:hypothetical protein
MKFNSITEIKKWFEEHEYAEEVHEAINFLLGKVNDVKPREFVGLEIKDFYCNGFFGRRYDLEGSIIIDNGYDYITVRTKDGDFATAFFDDGWKSEMRYFVEEWTRDKKGDDEWYEG